MLDQIKKKRLNLTHSFETTRPRINSSEKRKEIEANLQKFKKEVENSKPHVPSQSAKDFYKGESKQWLNQSPTMKDLINPFLKPASRRVSEEIESPRFKQSSQNKEQQQITDEKEDNSNNQAQKQKLLDEKPKEPQKIQQNKYENPLEASISPKKQKDHGQKLERQVSFGGEQLLVEVPKPSPRSIKNNSNKFEPTYQKNQNPSQLNFNYNDSNYGGSSNGSSAIFFTSQFKQYINRDKPQEPQLPLTVPQTQQPSQQHKKSEPSEHPSQTYTHTDKEIGDSFLKMGEQELSDLNESRSKKMTHNQSGRSLAFSNNDESMLRESKANQYVHDMINKKLDEELVLEIEHFGKNKLKDLAYRYQEFRSKDQIKDFGEDLVLLKKMIQLQKTHSFNLKRYYFDTFAIMKQQKFQQVKNKIKADSFKKQANQKLLKSIFNQWKDIGLEQQKKILINLNKRNEKMKKNIFQVFKIIWFDSKVRHQVDMYYLSKIFSALKNAAASERKKSQNVALKQYCKSLKRRYFQKLQQGIQALRQERMNQELAQQHCRATTIRKFFNAWLQQCSKSPQYVSLTMTSKNVFKQSADNKWLGVRTVDFSQLKQ